MKKPLLILGIISMFITQNAVSQTSIQLQEWMLSQRKHAKKMSLRQKH